MRPMIINDFGLCKALVIINSGCKSEKHLEGSEFAIDVKTLNKESECFCDYFISEYFKVL